MSRSDGDRNLFGIKKNKRFSKAKCHGAELFLTRYQKATDYDTNLQQNVIKANRLVWSDGSTVTNRLQRALMMDLECRMLSQAAN